MTRAHTVLHRTARRAIVSTAKRAGLKGRLTEEPRVLGKTRKWTFDLQVRARTRPTGLFLQHILVLPDVEETYQETAALARIWQDVKEARGRNAALTAVYYSRNGIPKNKLKAAQELLADDKITSLYSSDLLAYCHELAGQQRL